MRIALCNEVIRELPFGEGALAFSPILRTLSDSGYAGMAAVEPFLYEPDGPACAARAIGYVRGLMDSSTRHPGRA